MLYEIKVSCYNHVSGHDSWIDGDIKYEDINTAKRRLLTLVETDENLYDEDAELHIDKDLMWAYCEGRHNDYSDYKIIESEPFVIEKTISMNVSEEEMKTFLENLHMGNDTAIIEVEED